METFDNDLHEYLNREDEIEIYFCFYCDIEEVENERDICEECKYLTTI